MNEVVTIVVNNLLEIVFSQGNELCGGDERADCAGRKLDK